MAGKARRKPYEHSDEWESKREDLRDRMRSLREDVDTVARFRARGGGHPAVDAWQRALREAVLPALPPRQAEVVVHYYGEESRPKLKQIAQHMGVSPQAVSALLKDAVKNLTRLCGDDGWRSRLEDAVRAVYEAQQPPPKPKANVLNEGERSELAVLVEEVGRKGEIMVAKVGFTADEAEETLAEWRARLAEKWNLVSRAPDRRAYCLAALRHLIRDKMRAKNHSRVESPEPYLDEWARWDREIA